MSIAWKLNVSEVLLSYIINRRLILVPMKDKLSLLELQQSNALILKDIVKSKLVQIGVVDKVYVLMENAIWVIVLQYQTVDSARKIRTDFNALLAKMVTYQISMDQHVFQNQLHQIVLLFPTVFLVELIVKAKLSVQNALEI